MFTYGFYNSLNGDRKYDAVQMSQIFDGIIEDGIYANVGEQFMVIPGEGLQVIVKTGRAWFKHTWNLNDAWLPIDLSPADPLRNRIDSVIIEVNSNLDIRENSIKVVSGEVALYPVAPTMIHEDGIDQYRLADIKVNNGVFSITEEDITIKVGRDETPFVVAPIKSVDISDLFSQWQGQFDSFMAHIEEQLEGDVATNLQKQIDARVKIEDKASIEDLAEGTPGKWLDAEMAKDNVFGITNGLKIGDIVYSTRDLEAETGGKFLACDQRIISRDDYPELVDTDGVGCRIPNYENEPTFNSNNSASEWFFVDGPVRDNNYYSFEQSGTNFILYKTDLTNSDHKKSEIFRVSTTDVGGYGFIVLDDLYITGLIIDKNKWFIYEIDTGSFTYYTDSDPFTSMVGETRGIVKRSDGGLDVYCIPSTTTCLDSALTRSVIIRQFSYSVDLKKRTIVNHSIECSHISGNYWTVYNVCSARNRYTSELLNVMDDKIVFPVAVCVKRYNNTSDYSGGFRKIYVYSKNINDNDQIHNETEMSYTDFDLEEYNRLWDTNSSSYYAISNSHNTIIIINPINSMGNTIIPSLVVSLNKNLSLSSYKYYNKRIFDTVVYTIYKTCLFLKDKEWAYFNKTTLQSNNNEDTVKGVVAISLSDDLKIEMLDTYSNGSGSSTVTDGSIFYYVDQEIPVFLLGNRSNNNIYYSIYHAEKMMLNSGIIEKDNVMIVLNRRNVFENVLTRLPSSPIFGPSYAILIDDNKIVFFNEYFNKYMIIDGNVRVLPYKSNAFIKALE